MAAHGLPAAFKRVERVGYYGFQSLQRQSCVSHSKTRRTIHGNANANFRVEQLPGFGRALVASRDLAKGETVIVEPALLAFLRLLQRGSRCHYCFTHLDSKSLAFRFERDTKLGRSRDRHSEEEEQEHFCSESCLHSAREGFNGFLSSPLRNWPALLSSCNTSGRAYPLIVSRLFASMLLNASRTGRIVDRTSELVFNTDNSREESVADYGLVKELLLTERGQSDLLNLNFFLAKVSMLNLNAVSVTLPGHFGEMERVGTALFLESSFLNHNCTPNLDVSFSHGTGDKREVTLNAIANADTPKGDQLFISYVDADSEPYNDGDERRAFLRAAYGFECRCPRCVKELTGRSQNVA
jgi:hypothetical protein